MNTPNVTSSPMSREVGLPLTRAIAAFGRGACGDAVEDLTRIRANAHRFGGSHAQRDVVHLTLIESALRAGQNALARALAAERTAVKRSSPFNWRLTARALEAQGHVEEARLALETADMRAAAQKSERVPPTRLSEERTMRTNTAETVRAVVVLLIAAFPTLALIASHASVAQSRAADVMLSGEHGIGVGSEMATRERRCERMVRLGGVTRTRYD